MTDNPDLTLNDGHRMPQLGFGMFEVPQEKAAGVVQEGLKAGYRLIDGAAIYGNEEQLGDGLRRSDMPREEVFVTSKIWNADQGYDATSRALDQSLGRIGTEYLDLVLIHWPCPAQDLYVDTWRALIAARADGRARSIGVSNFLPEHIDRIVDETGEAPAVNQIELHPEFQQRDARAAHEKRGIVTQDWTPLGRGGAFDAEPVQNAARRTGKSPAQVILRWHIQIGSAVIPRSTRSEGLAENIDLFDFELSPDEMEAIAALDSGRRTGPDPASFGA